MVVVVSRHELFEDSVGLLRRALLLGADECELVCVERDAITVRITESRIAESKHVLQKEYGIRMVVRGRITSAHTYDHCKIKDMLERCVSDASCTAMHPCTFWRGLARPSGRSSTMGEIYDPRLGSSSMKAGAAEDAAWRMIDAALPRGRQATVTGSVNIVSETFEICNTNGLYESERATYATCMANTESGDCRHAQYTDTGSRMGYYSGGRATSAGGTSGDAGTGAGGDSTDDAAAAPRPAALLPYSMSGMGHSAARTLAGLDPESAGEAAARMYLESENPVSIDDTCPYTIIFSPYSVGELLAFVASPNFGLKRVSDGMSCLSGHTADRQKVASESVSIYDDPHAPEGMGSHRIDAEGLPTVRRPLVERGRFAGTYSDLSDHYRSAAGRGPDDRGDAGAHFANAVRMSSRLGRSADPIPASAPHNLALEAADPGDAISAEEMIRDVRRGLLVGRLWYTYAVNPIRGDFSCTARSGILLVENGHIVSAARPLRIMHSLPALLAGISGVGDDSQCVIQWASLPSIAPSLRVEGVPVARI